MKHINKDDKFFTQTNCDRCNEPLKMRIMSWFTNETICRECFQKETEIKAKLPDRGREYEGCGFIPDATHFIKPNTE